MAGVKSPTSAGDAKVMLKPLPSLTPPGIQGYMGLVFRGICRWYSGVYVVGIQGYMGLVFRGVC